MRAHVHSRMYGRAPHMTHSGGLFHVLILELHVMHRFSEVFCVQLNNYAGHATYASY